MMLVPHLQAALQGAGNISPADMNKHLSEMLGIVQRLITLVEAENHLLETERPSAIQPLLEEKGRLSSELAYGLQKLKSDAASLEASDKTLRATLSQTLEQFQELVLQNGRIVLRLKSVSEGILGAIVEEAQKGKRPAATYAPGNGTGNGAPRAPAASIALNAVV